MPSTFASSRKLAAVNGNRNSGPPQVRSSRASANHAMSSGTGAGSKRRNFTAAASWRWLTPQHDVGAALRAEDQAIDRAVVAAAEHVFPVIAVHEERVARGGQQLRR